MVYFMAPSKMGLTIYAAAFAALYLRLASLDFKLDTVELAPLGLFGWPFQVHSGENMRSAKPGVAGGPRNRDNAMRDDAHPASRRFGRSPTEARRRGRMCSEAYPEPAFLNGRWSGREIRRWAAA